MNDIPVESVCLPSVDTRTQFLMLIDIRRTLPAKIKKKESELFSNNIHRTLHDLVFFTLGIEICLGTGNSVRSHSELTRLLFRRYCSRVFRRPPRLWRTRDLIFIVCCRRGFS